MYTAQNILLKSVWRNMRKHVKSKRTIFDKFFFSSHQVLKSCDAHSNEYVNRLKDEPKVVAILEKGQRLLEAKSAPASDMCRIYLKRIEHVYFKFDPRVVQQKNVSESTRPNRRWP